MEGRGRGRRTIGAHSPDELVTCLERPRKVFMMVQAGQKGTGKWTSVEAQQLGAPAATIAEAVFARCLSALKEERLAAAGLLRGPEGSFAGDREEFAEDVRAALYASKVCSYAQGFHLLALAAAEHGWRLDYGRIAGLWRGGCIIRARFLDRIAAAEPPPPRPTTSDRLLLGELDPPSRRATGRRRAAGPYSGTRPLGRAARRQLFPQQLHERRSSR